MTKYDNPRHISFYIKKNIGMKHYYRLSFKFKPNIVKCDYTGFDRYGRLIGNCRIGKILINSWMVKNGWAIAYRYYSTDYIVEEKYAHDNKLGIWKSKFVEPYEYRKKNKN